MQSTSLSLLQRLHHTDDRVAWDQFAQIYIPLLRSWSRRLGLKDDAASDFVQEVFLVLMREMPRFRHDGIRCFRAWLKTVFRHCWSDWHRRARRELPTSPLPAEGPAVSDPIEEIVDSAYRAALVRSALLLMQKDFEPTTWRACWLTAAKGLSGAEAACRLGISVGAVYVAKNRVLDRLRRELRGQFD